MTISAPTENKSNDERGFYLHWLAAFFLLLALCVAGFNTIIDPRGVFLFVDQPGFNQAKVTLSRNSRQGKATALRQCGFDALILGTSRAETAIPMQDEALSGLNPYNAALRGGTVYEMRRMGSYALEQGRLKAAVISLDFESFNARIPFTEDFQESSLAEKLSIDAIARYLFSQHTVMQSWTTLLANIRGVTNTCDDRGEYRRSRELEAARITFDYILRTYRKGHYSDYVAGNFHFQHFEALLKELREAGVETYLFISPVHVTQLELMTELQLIDDYENWKRQLVSSVTNVNRDVPDQEPLLLWDFSGYNDITTELVPDPERQRFMRYYEDSSHYNQHVGSIILERMLGTEPVAETSAGQFGVVLTHANIDEQIAADRLGSATYRRANPAEIARLRTMLESGQ